MIAGLSLCLLIFTIMICIELSNISTNIDNIAKILERKLK